MKPNVKALWDGKYLPVPNEIMRQHHDKNKYFLYKRKKGIKGGSFTSIAYFTSISLSFACYAAMSQKLKSFQEVDPIRHFVISLPCFYQKASADRFTCKCDHLVAWPVE